MNISASQSIVWTNFTATVANGQSTSQSIKGLSDATIAFEFLAAKEAAVDAFSPRTARVNNIGEPAKHA